MREYHMVLLNKGISLSREKDLKKADELLNQYIAEGWTLQQVVSSADGTGDLIAVLYRE